LKRLSPNTAASLAGAVLCDRLSDGLSLVYSFYDPELQDRSLGTHIILDHLAYAKSLRLPYVYLGYWIEGSRKMAYKARFLPQERLTRQGWVRIDEPPAGG
jgi:arginyl-tRNA--protein-N-Asp/Glu arginylyltransferase